MTSSLSLDLASLRETYKSRWAKPSDVIDALYSRLQSGPLEPVWISLTSRAAAMARARELERDPLATALPLYGVPFAVKDNIDVAGLPTTAACPAFAYQPAANAAVVQALVDAGAIPIGKTNLDQFATGLAGTRTPHGACSSVFDPRYISGGSSSGSAVAVASGLVGFSLGTDTAGSGRIPAAFNNLVGLKPTRGVISTAGVVPACRSLDCISIFAHTCHDAHTAWLAARGFDPNDSYSRAPRPGEGAAPWAAGRFRFGVPSPGRLEFFGDEQALELYARALASLERIGGERVEIDFAPFRAAAGLLDAGPRLAEHLAALGPFLADHAEQMDPIVRQAIARGSQYSAVDAFAAEYQLREFARAAEREWERMDVLALPTTGTIYTHEAVAADPIRLNTNLGYYTDFVNPLDLAAVALPAGFRGNGLPFGISLIGRAFTEEGLLSLGDRFHRTQTTLPGPAVDTGAAPPECIPLAVVGAHLTGQPLNSELTRRGARLLKATRTAAGYRLYRLNESFPPKPGLVRDAAFQGPGIEVEVWAMPSDQLGGFVADVPPPLGIGSAVLESGETVKCFITEPHSIRTATDITRFGGWRNFLNQPH